MKAKILILLICIGLGACSKEELTKDEALTLLVQEKGFPRTIDFEIFTADPAHAKKLLDANLESDGYVMVQRAQKLGEVGNPLVNFTEKARPFLLPVSDEESKVSVQKVKIADENVVEINSITEDRDAGTVEVSYTTNYTNTTPFAVLVKNTDKPKNLLARFKNDGEKWILVRNK